MIHSAPNMEISKLEGYQNPKRIKYNFITLGVVSFILQIVCLILFSFVRFWVENGYIPNELSGSFSFGSLFGTLLMFMLAIIFHEAVHGMTFTFLGYKVKYGLLLPFAAYAIAQGQLIKKRDYFFVSLSPLFVIDAIAILLLFTKIPALSDIALFVLVVNTAGAIGDLWMVSKIIKCPKGTLFFDSSPKDNYVYVPVK